MTEAGRAAYPAHLLWHTAKHCWDNIPGGQRRYDVAKTVEKPPTTGKTSTYGGEIIQRQNR
jgi:hypothetical protein